MEYGASFLLKQIWFVVQGKIYWRILGVSATSIGLFSCTVELIKSYDSAELDVNEWRS